MYIRTFSKLASAKILVIGDFMLDTYTFGKAHRISPEAPVAIVHAQKDDYRSGGAGNVCLNLAALGAKVIALGRVGEDPAGDKIRNILKQQGISTYLYKQSNYPTPIKNRIISDNQQIVRIDWESIEVLSEIVEQKIIETLPELLTDVKVIAISDYGKGFLTNSLLESLLSIAKAKKIVTIADPKGIDFSKYKGANIIKPNYKEAVAASGLSHNEPLEKIAKKLFGITDADYLFITRAEKGISLFDRNSKCVDFPVQVHDIKDVTGAGDTVLAMIAHSIANGLSLTEAAQLANVAASIAIEHLGCISVSLSQLAKRLLEQDVTNKVFEEHHLFALQEVLKDTSFTILGVSGAQGLTSAIFNAIRELGNRKGWSLLVYLQDLNPSAEFIDILSSLHNVDFIILNKENLTHLCNILHPNEIYTVDNGVCKQLENLCSIDQD